MTEFGRTLYSLMLSRGIEFRQDLATLLTEAGYKVSQQTISNYMNGKRTIDPDFPLFVSEVLDLNEEEECRLAKAYTFGSTRLTQQHVERIHAFREQLKVLRGESAGGKAADGPDG
jgi:transcriptional regulator with XRE-family HTH domain